ncbi:NAD-dependent epimerase [Halobacillus sp. A5]|uniref:NAD-dependent epimerase n=1 Tax=Halobacillus sp. A5 TaxID=2880263 RepID=UPI0020A62EAE|nr:NAD-dependent epimerase [Halobacillus sp. A5]MCP3029437.1 NAD-dependent epimerase [Halobacillus sp. A5]
MILLTGAAGFIGAHLAKRLLSKDHNVLGIDNLNSYYDVQLKEDRLDWIQHPNFTFEQVDRVDKNRLDALFKKHQPSLVIDLAAQAGVRYSLENPQAYVDSNITGFLNILEACRHYKAEQLIYASSSSVYGANTKMPFSVKDNVDHPVSLYAATKKANELMAHTYSHLYSLPTTGLRFFTVYGPWGRPDMALFTFTKSILEGKPIQVFNQGSMMRDFTYIDDIVEGIVRLIKTKPSPDPEWKGETPDPSKSSAPYRIYNMGNSKPVKLMDFITAIENKLSITAHKEYLPLQSGDVIATYADVEDLIRDTGYKPNTPIDKGVGKFIDWYRAYYGV